MRPATSGPRFVLDRGENIAPLDTQFAADPKRDLPQPLVEPLFGQPPPDSGDIAAARGDVQRVPPMQTYVVLDAARITNLPEMLGVSGLEHACLFKGDALQILGAVAP